MKFSCTQDNLRRGLSAVSHVSGKQGNLPVLQNVHIKADGGGIVLSTTNLEIAIRTTVRGKIDAPGEFTVPAKLLHDFVNLLSGERVDVERVGDVLHICCGDTSTSMNGMDAAEFPLIPSVETTHKIAIPGQALRDGVAQVVFSVSASEARPELSGVLMKFDGERLVLAATDSYRLSERTISLVGNVESRQIILPSQTAHEVHRMLSVYKDDPDVEDTLEVRLSDTQAVFAYGAVELTTRTIDGTYPDYVQIIPTEFATEAVVGRDEFVKAVKTASLFSRPGVFDVTIQIDPATKKLSVKATEATRGENTAGCEADVRGKQNTITVNHRYLIDGLGACTSEGVTFKMIDAMNPCLLMPNGQADTGAPRYIIMPIRA